MDDLNQVDFAFNWTPEMSVGSEFIDMQHRQLLGEVNALLSAMIHNEPYDVIHKTITFLDKYITGHLADEELYMQEHNYPDFSAHKQMHESFIKQYTEFKQKLKETGPTQELTSEVQTYIGEWWIHHIAKEDKKYADYIAASK